LLDNVIALVDAVIGDASVNGLVRGLLGGLLAQVTQALGGGLDLRAVATLTPAERTQRVFAAVNGPLAIQASAYGSATAVASACSNRLTALLGTGHGS